jgi:TPR repeat protein
MRRRILVACAAAIVASIMVLGLFVLRNFELDAAVSALKVEDGETFVRKIKPLAELGDGTAQFLLGFIYALGCPGVQKNDGDAVYWLRRAAFMAEPGVDPAAPAELGVAKDYAEGGDGVKADPVEGAKWLRLAAAGGSKEAAAILRGEKSDPR